MLSEVNGESAASKTSTFEWYKRFQVVCEDDEDEKRTGRPITPTTDEDVEKVNQKVASQLGKSQIKFTELLDLSWHIFKIMVIKFQIKRSVSSTACAYALQQQFLH